MAANEAVSWVACIGLPCKRLYVIRPPGHLPSGLAERSKRSHRGLRSGVNVDVDVRIADRRVSQKSRRQCNRNILTVQVRNNPQGTITHPRTWSAWIPTLPTPIPHI